MTTLSQIKLRLCLAKKDYKPNKSRLYNKTIPSQKVKTILSQIRLYLDK